MCNCTSWKWYKDNDGDGLGDPTNLVTTACGAQAPVGYVSNNIDVNDSMLSNLAWNSGTNQILTVASHNPEISFSKDSTLYSLLVNASTQRLSVFKMAPGGSWSAVGAQNFSGQLMNGRGARLALNQNTPYVSYVGNTGALVVMSYVPSTGWETVGSTGVASANDTDISMYGLEPYVAYTSGGDLHVIKYSGGAWQAVGGVIGYGIFSEIVIDSNGIPYIAFSDGNNSGKITVKKFNGATWIAVGDPGFSTDYIDVATDIEVDGNNIPYVTYYDGGEDKIIVKKFIEDTWTPLGTSDIYVGQPAAMSLAVDYWGIPYVAYSDAVNNNYTVKKIANNDWAVVVSDPITRSTGVAVYGDFITITLSAGGVPYIAFVDNSSAAYTSVLALSDMNSPLPITLLYFKGSTENEAINLVWATAVEINFNYFLVECSSDGKNFEFIGRVYGGNRGGITEQYTYKDHHPAGGLTYYRLKSVDLDGSYAYSTILAFHISSLSATFTVYPNPTIGDRVFFKTSIDPLPGDHIQIISMMGKVVFNIGVQEGEFEIAFDMPLPVGEYIVRYFSTEETFSTRMVVTQL